MWSFKAILTVLEKWQWQDVEHIVAVDGNPQRLEFAKKMGAEKSVNFMEHKGIDALAEAVKEAFGAQGLTLVEERNKGEWYALIYRG